MYLCDLHSHSKISPDSEAELLDTARAAIAAGLSEFCVTDHCDLLDLDGNPCASFDWPAARAQFHTVRSALGDKLTLRLGIELGSAPYDPAAARAIRGLSRPDAAAVPILAMSANAFAEDIAASREAGMNEHITKPLDIPRLMDALSRWLPETEL